MTFVDSDPLSHDSFAGGVVVGRRALLTIPLAMSASGAMKLLQEPDSKPASRATGGSALSTIDIQQFEQEWKTIAKELGGSKPEADEIYANLLSSLIARIPLQLLPKLTNGKGSNGLIGGPSWVRLPCVMVEFQMEPGAMLRLHNHPPQVVVTLCAEGACDFRHFEHEGEAPPCTQIDGKQFKIRESRRGVLSTARTTALTRTRDGFHTFKATKKGARIIDFIVSFGDTSTFSYVQLSEKPIDAEAQVYEAVWLGKK
ncbi:MAG: hypothetical protein ACKVS6_03470 [Planctomycetota bacterium]